MADFIQVATPASPSLVDGVIVPEKDGVFGIKATAMHEWNGHGSPAMRIQITINDVVDYESKIVFWKDGPAQQQALTTEFMRAGQEYKIEARSFNSNAQATGITLSAQRV